MSQQRIEHKGIVQDAKAGLVTVSIIAQSACVSCSVNGSCSVADLEDKLIEVKTNHTQFSKGDHVNVYYKQSLGFRALFLGYLLPFLVLFITLIIALQFSTEGLAGLISLSTLVPYYIILYVIKDKLRTTFSFQIEKLDTIQFSKPELQTYNT